MKPKAVNVVDVINRAVNASPFQLLLRDQVDPCSQDIWADLLATSRRPGRRGPNQSVIGAIEHPTLVRSVLLNREKHATPVNAVSVTPIQLCHLHRRVEWISMLFHVVSWLRRQLVGVHDPSIR